MLGSGHLNLALGINTKGQKELLGMWLAENEGAKFWQSVPWPPGHPDSLRGRS
ncbi:transposase IS1113 [Salmonella enterica subsp. enterica serovar Sanjuan]|uniref:Transposase IS1113 n=1 Tax=Salmonella enterica subsp. enterica serovar Sanjuan TaxID=1160765 RepID=A0A3S4FIM8_SALET|nr:transposase IS1113 [Salmonella enterica subsp. enterica serovar Sanjuan]